MVYNIEPKGKGVDMAKGSVRIGCYKLISGEWWDDWHAKPQAQYEQQDLVQKKAERLIDDDAGGEGPWIFDVCNDVSELTNLYSSTDLDKERLQLYTMLERYHGQMVPALFNLYDFDDRNANPALRNNTWAPWNCHTDSEPQEDALLTLRGREPRVKRKTEEMLEGKKSKNIISRSRKSHGGGGKDHGWSLAPSTSIAA